MLGNQYPNARITHLKGKYLCNGIYDNMNAKIYIWYIYSFFVNLLAKNSTHHTLWSVLKLFHVLYADQDHYSEFFHIHLYWCNNSNNVHSYHNKTYQKNGTAEHEGYHKMFLHAFMLLC